MFTPVPEISEPGPATDGDTAAWNDSLVALSGPLEVCGDLGVPLW